MKHYFKHLCVFIFCIGTSVGHAKSPKEATVTKKQLWKAILEQDMSLLQDKKIPLKYFKDTNKERYTPLTAAIDDTQNVALIQALLEQGADPNAKDRKKRLPLHLAVLTEQKDCVEVLLRHKADANQKDVDGDTPLAVAIKKNLQEIALLLVEQGADPELCSGSSGVTPLHLAIKKRNLTLTEILVNKYKVDINNKGIVGLYPVVYAASHRCHDIMDFLLQKGALVVPKEPAITILHAMSMYDYINLKHNDGEALKKFYDKYKPFIAEEDLSVFTAHTLNAAQNKDITPYLDQIDVQTQDEYGNTPLHYAVEYRSLFNVIKLLEKGASVHSTNNNLDTPLYQVIMNEGEENALDILMARVLLEKGANVDHFDSRYSVLARAVMKNKPRLCKLLLEYHANTNLVVSPLIKPHTFTLLPDERPFLSHGSGLFHIAAIYCVDLDIVTQLIQAGVNVNAKDSYGSTALHYAGHYDNIPLLTILLANGALLIKNKKGHTPLTFEVLAKREWRTETYYICGDRAKAFLKAWIKNQKKAIKEAKKNPKNKDAVTS
ncbi:ankyrin repeat domain-containing protein [Cardinium endosymbiont of Culicoides punctatus]|uniref:ankyrin repeat domain-containing protein n=1 Tax=Cardinium endosymbiont of Culicoides punctatus TaxID=2304601 RepID=UPI001058AA12|nr:ankyrin repeat domain-containing protein [Cardinium endosymbiont of Culicoides punctatus]TDG95738.1 hypothetical protein CCPUN_00220 [Cardinium endosymbiont of Culicoides punctatus]